MRDIRQFIYHQTGTATGTLESIDRYHRLLGWKSCGYHFLITPDAVIHKGRPQSVVGAHCKGDNAHSLGICCVGAGDAFPLDVGYMSTPMFEALIQLTQQLRGAYPTVGSALWGHRERASGKIQGKTCPGFDVDILRKLLC